MRKKALEAEDREKAGSSARAGTRGHQITGEVNKKEAIVKEEEEDAIIKKEGEDVVCHGCNRPTGAQGPKFKPKVGIFRCGDCRLDKTVSSRQAAYCYSSITEFNEHHRSGYHSRAMRSFRRAEGRVVRKKAKCCGGFWTAEEFVGHVAEKHPDV